MNKQILIIDTGESTDVTSLSGRSTYNITELSNVNTLTHFRATLSRPMYIKVPCNVFVGSITLSGSRPRQDSTITSTILTKRNDLYWTATVGENISINSVYATKGPVMTMEIIGTGLVSSINTNPYVNSIDDTFVNLQKKFVFSNTNDHVVAGNNKTTSVDIALDATRTLTITSNGVITFGNSTLTANDFKAGDSIFFTGLLNQKDNNIVYTVSENNTTTLLKVIDRNKTNIEYTLNLSTTSLTIAAAAKTLTFSSAPSLDSSGTSSNLSGRFSAGDKCTFNGLSAAADNNKEYTIVSATNTVITVAESITAQSVTNSGSIIIKYLKDAWPKNQTSTSSGSVHINSYGTGGNVHTFTGNDLNYLSTMWASKKNPIKITSLDFKLNYSNRFDTTNENDNSVFNSSKDSKNRGIIELVFVPI